MEDNQNKEIEQWNKQREEQIKENWKEIEQSNFNREEEMKEKYDNGCVEKTIKTDIPFACKNEVSTKEDIEAEGSSRTRNISNIINNKIKKNKLSNVNINTSNKLLDYNKNQSVCLSEENDGEEFDDTTKILLYLQNICEQIQEYDRLTKYTHTNLCGRLQKMFRKLAKSSEPIGIGEEILFPVQILNKVSGVMPRARELGSFMKRFNELCKIADTPQVRNKYRYLIASIYNEVQGI